MEFVRAFLVGGILCAIGQIFIDKTKVTAARILTAYVVAGVILTMIGLYEPLVKFGEAGAIIPLTGFGYALAKGVQRGVAEHGLLGILSGGVVATAAGISAAILFGYLFALISKPAQK